MARKFNAQQIAGYVFDGSLIQRAKVNTKGIIANAETGLVVPIQPSFAMWWTRRNIQNALARLEAKGILTSVSLGAITPTKELIELIGAPRLTKDHAIHLMTAGVERILERKFTDAEIKAFDAEAEKIVNAMDAAMPVLAKKSA